MVSPTLNAMDNSSESFATVLGTTTTGVRRLTPTECERLQGFPDDYTDIPWRGQPHSPDGPRYRALGNSMAVPVMNWIGKRINQVEKILDERRKEAPQPRR